MSDIDVSETLVLKTYPNLLDILLIDQSSGSNIIWATKHYWRHGKGFQQRDQIKRESITGKNEAVIKPRIKKSNIERKARSRENAEVFTPSWICNVQNNLVDDEWFGYKQSFNKETMKGWKSSKKVEFRNGLNWREYIDLERLEIACGEAPYLTSRYDAVTGEYIKPEDRIGFFDRKLRVINENAKSKSEWLKCAEIALKRIYGYDYQGDNVLLARENVLYTYADYYKAFFNLDPDLDLLIKLSKIISWNIWQMDGLKYVIPLSCHKEEPLLLSLFPDQPQESCYCQGCKANNPFLHNGTYCKIKDWRVNKTIRFVDLTK